MRYVGQVDRDRSQKIYTWAYCALKRDAHPRAEWQTRTDAVLADLMCHIEVKVHDRVIREEVDCSGIKRFRQITKCRITGATTFIRNRASGSIQYSASVLHNT